MRHITITTTPTRASATIPAAPERVFALLTDIERLPSWNDEIIAVLERPAALVPGAQWAVQMRAAGMTWPSRTWVLAVDHQIRRFVYRSGSDDGNPSFTIWTWEVAPHPDGARVTVAWDPNPRTFWRRAFVVHWRRRCLARQVPRSLHRLAAALAEPVAAS
jgi:uncharacterized protein YndB with AHSA1/START domain